MPEEKDPHSKAKILTLMVRAQCRDIAAAAHCPNLLEIYSLVCVCVWWSCSWGSVSARLHYLTAWGGGGKGGGRADAGRLLVLGGADSWALQELVLEKPPAGRACHVSKQKKGKHLLFCSGSLVPSTDKT